MAAQMPSRSSSFLPAVVGWVCSRTSSGTSRRKVPLPMDLISMKDSPTQPSACPAIRCSFSPSRGTSP